MYVLVRTKQARALSGFCPLLPFDGTDKRTAKGEKFEIEKKKRTRKKKKDISKRSGLCRGGKGENRFDAP